MWRKRAPYRCEECRDEAAPSAEDGADSDEELNGGSDQRNDVDDEHVFHNALVGVQTIFQLFREQALSVGAIQAPHLNRIEPKLSLPWRAERVLIIPIP